VLEVSGDEQFNSTILMLKIMENNTRSSLSQILETVRAFEHRLDGSALFRYSGDTNDSSGAHKTSSRGIAGGDRRAVDAHGRGGGGGGEGGDQGGGYRQGPDLLVLLAELVSKQGEQLQQQARLLEQQGSDIREIRDLNRAVLETHVDLHRTIPRQGGGGGGGEQRQQVGEGSDYRAPFAGHFNRVHQVNPTHESAPGAAPSEAAAPPITSQRHGRYTIPFQHVVGAQVAIHYRRRIHYRRIHYRSTPMQISDNSLITIMGT